MATKTLYIGNLPTNATEAALSTHFSEFGATNARIMEGRGFGFIDIDEAKMRDAIAAMDNSMMDGSTLSVNEARPRQR